MYTPEPMVQRITKAKYPHSRPEEVNLNHHSVKDEFSGAFQLLVLVFCQDHCLLFLSDLGFQLCPLLIGFASHQKLHLDAKACKVTNNLKEVQGKCHLNAMIVITCL